MYYRAFATLEDNERNFVIGLALEVNNAKVKKQTIPNKNLIEITKELIKKHKIDFEQFERRPKDEPRRKKSCGNTTKKRKKFKNGGKRCENI